MNIIVEILIFKSRNFAENRSKIDKKTCNYYKFRISKFNLNSLLIT